MKKIVRAVAALVMIAGLTGALFMPQQASAQLEACDINSSSDLCATERRSNQGDGYSYVVRNVVNTILYIVGVAAVIVIVISGLRYVISAGNTQAVQSAKNSLVYAVIGLLVAIIAYAIVNFVLLELT